jgi:uncharacterized protein (DUF433 family)
VRGKLVAGSHSPSASRDKIFHASERRDVRYSYLQPRFVYILINTCEILDAAFARSEMDYLDRITIEPDKRSGKPCIRGLRITVQDVLEYLASGMTEGEILDDFPDLEPDDIRACLSFAADRERRLMAGL